MSIKYVGNAMVETYVMNEDVAVQTAEEARIEAKRHSCGAQEIVLTEELLSALREGKLIFIEANDVPVFVTLKPFINNI